MKRFASLMISAAILVGACDWRKLDEAVETAPVRTFGPPSDFSASDVGNVLAPMPPTGDAAVMGRFFFASIIEPSLGYAEIDPEGKVAAYAVPQTVLQGQEKEFRTIAAFPDGTGVLVAQPRLPPSVGDAFTTGRVFALQFAPVPGGGAPAFGALSEVAGAVANEHWFGAGIAIGNFGGMPGLLDYAVASNVAVSVLVDGVSASRLRTPSTCGALEGVELLGDEFKTQRAIGFLDVLPGGTDEVVAGIPALTQPGRVVVLQKNPLVETELACALTVVPPADRGDVTKFGASMLLADVNGDAVPDLVVGAPPTGVFVYPGPIANAATTVPVFIGPPAGLIPAANFGSRLAALEADGTRPGLEIAVSAPKAPGFKGGTIGAGQVFVFDGAGTSLAVAYDQDPDSNSGLGSGLISVPIVKPCPPAGPRDVLVAGSQEEVFVFHRLQSTGALMRLEDTRCPKAP